MIKVFRSLMELFFGLVSVSAIAQTDFVFSDAIKPDSLKVSFSTKDSLIQVNALVNGKNEKFILDNACPYLVINSRHWEMKADSNILARGIGGKIESGTVFIDSFYWQGIHKAKFKAVAASLSNLGDSICGLIGYDVLKDYAVKFDFDSSRLSMHRPDSIFISRIDSNLLAIPFQMVKHIPVINVIFESDTLLMGIDCANTQNLLGSKALNRLQKINNLRRTILRGGGDSAMLIMEGEIDRFFVEGLPYSNMKFSFDDKAMNQINQTLPTKIDGLLGLSFLKRYKTMIDFPNRRIYIEKE